MTTALASHGRGRIFAAYRPLPGVADEMMDDKGVIRPHWRRLAAHLDAARPETLAADRARAERYLRDSGVFYRQYGLNQSIERPWPLSPVPVLIDAAEWEALAEGLMQRADLLEAVISDLYGENRLVASGRLPPALVAGNPEWLRPLVGQRPAGGRFLHFVAFELGRGPDGRWWVLADRTQAPSGAGYALENRVATRRAFAQIYQQENIPRLAGFFRQFRAALMAARSDPDSRVAILSPGPLNETYYEQAYIARYLGLTLVQGQDLVVNKGRLMVRTVEGQVPVDVLWRRLDAAYADPLELDPGSRLGTPGLVSAIRAGGLGMVNALGSGVLEARALMAFLPELAPDLVGGPLTIPNIATWWCGDARARADVLEVADRLLLSDAMDAAQPFGPRGARIRAGELSPAALKARLEREGASLAAQEAVTLSTTPALVGGQLVPRPVSMRVFLAWTGEGWTAMPGAFARIGASPDPEALAMQYGGSAADVWIVGGRPVDPVSLVPPATAPYRRAEPDPLPSRAADNLFWLGRYVERSEGMIRQLRAYNTRLLETEGASAPLMMAVESMLETQGLDPEKGIPDGLLEAIDSAIYSAGQVRDRFSLDAWSALLDLGKTARRMAARVKPGDDAVSALSALLRKLAGISGLVHENMYRAMGWRFLAIGRQHERALGMAEMLAALTSPDAPDGVLDLAIEIGDSVMTHRRRFTLATSRETVIDLLGLDPLNPRSLLNQIEGLCEQISNLPGALDRPPGAPPSLAEVALHLQADLSGATPASLDPGALRECHRRLLNLSDQLTETYFN